MYILMRERENEKNIERENEIYFRIYAIRNQNPNEWLRKAIQSETLNVLNYWSC